MLLLSYGGAPDKRPHRATLPCHVRRHSYSGSSGVTLIRTCFPCISEVVFLFLSTLFTFLSVLMDVRKSWSISRKPQPLIFLAFTYFTSFIFLIFWESAGSFSVFGVSCTHKTGFIRLAPALLFPLLTSFPVEGALLFFSYFDQIWTVNIGSVGMYVKRFRIELL